MAKKVNIVESPDESAVENTELNPDGETDNTAEDPELNGQNSEVPSDEAAQPPANPELAEFDAEKEEADENPYSAAADTSNDSRSDNTGPVKKPRKTRAAAKKPDTAPQSDGEPEKTPRKRTRNAAIVSIDESRSVETSADKHNNDLLDLVESLKSKKILSGTIQGVERSADNPNLSYAVVYHGDFKVIIPAEEVIEPPEDFRDRSPGDVMHYMITKRLGAEIDFIVKGVDKAGIAAASRLEAMAAKRKEYYFGFDRDGNNHLYEGITAEARVVSAIRAGIFVDLFGLETYIPLRELSYQRGVDAAAQFQPGQRVLVKVLSIDRTNRNKIQVSASVKQATDNPYEKALRKYVPGSRYVGTVSMVDTNGVFVSLDGGIDCLCSYPKRGRPPRGSRVTVRIIGINQESNRIWGAITHMTTAR